MPGGTLAFVKLEQPRYDARITVCAIGEANHGAARPFITYLRPANLHCGGTGLSTAAAAAFDSYPKREFWR